MSPSRTPAERIRYLSGREFEVFVRMGEGMRAGEIAAALAVSVKSVSTYRARIRDKLGVFSNAAVIELAESEATMAVEKQRDRRTRERRAL